MENIFRKVASGKEPNNYIQIAGSSSALTIEIGKVLDTGEICHWTIGRRAAETAAGSFLFSGGGTGYTEIHWDSFATSVSPSEVFDAASAAQVFSEYIKTGDAPEASYTKRPTALE